MPEHPRVLVLDVGEAPYALAVARSLGAAGCRVTFGFPSGAAQREAVSRYCASTISYPDPAFEPADFQQSLVRVAGSFDVIVPCKEPSLLATAVVREQLEAQGAMVPIADRTVLETATDKTRMLQVAEAAGVRIPRGAILRDFRSLDEVRSLVGWPFVIKVTSEIGLRPIERHYRIDASTATAYEDRFRELSAHGPVIVQEFVEGSGAGVALLYDAERRLVAYSGHERIFEQFADGGPSLLAQTSVEPAVLDPSRRLLERLGWKGIAMVEFRRTSTGEPVFMEVNPRFWGTLPLAIDSGVDFPRLLLERFRESSAPAPIGPSRLRRYFSFEVLATALEAPPGKRPRVGSLAMRLCESTRGLSIRELQGNDPRPAFEELLHVLRGRGTERRIARVDGVYFGPARPYDGLDRYGIRTVIDLREDREISTPPGPASMRRLRFPIPDDTGLDPDRFHELLTMVRTAAGNGAVYIHCRRGMGRAPMVAAGVLVEAGATPDAASRQVYDARPFADLQAVQRAAIYRLARSRDGHRPRGPDPGSPGPAG